MQKAGLNKQAKFNDTVCTCGLLKKDVTVQVAATLKRRTRHFQESQESPSVILIQPQDGPAKILPWWHKNIPIIKWVAAEISFGALGWTACTEWVKSKTCLWALIYTNTANHLFRIIQTLVTCPHKGLVVSWTRILTHPNAHKQEKDILQSQRLISKLDELSI